MVLFLYKTHGSMGNKSIIHVHETYVLYSWRPEARNLQGRADNGGQVDQRSHPDRRFECRNDEAGRRGRQRWTVHGSGEDRRFLKQRFFVFESHPMSKQRLVLSSKTRSRNNFCEDQDSNPKWLDEMPERYLSAMQSPHDTVAVVTLGAGKAIAIGIRQAKKGLIK